MTSDFSEQGASDSDTKINIFDMVLEENWYKNENKKNKKSCIPFLPNLFFCLKFFQSLARIALITEVVLGMKIEEKWKHCNTWMHPAGFMSLFLPQYVYDSSKH